MQNFKFTNEDELSGEEKFILALEIFELGRLNMYGAFNLEETKKAYQKIEEILQDLGIEVQKVNFVDLNEWF